MHADKEKGSERCSTTWEAEWRKTEEEYMKAEEVLERIATELKSLTGTALKIRRKWRHCWVLPIVADSTMSLTKTMTTTASVFPGYDSIAGILLGVMSVTAR